MLGAVVRVAVGLGVASALSGPGGASTARDVRVRVASLDRPTTTEVATTTEARPLGSSALDAERAKLASLVDDDDDDEAAAAEKRRQRLMAAEKPMDVFVVGLSHHNAAVEVREKLAIPEADWEAAARELVSSSEGAVVEAAILSTCNRFEVYFSARDSREAIKATTSYLQQRADLPMADLRSSLFMLGEQDAVAHAFKVAGGLDSLVVGEGQILAQIKACYDHAVAPKGAGGKVTARLLNAAVAAGKRVRTETGISKGAVSISSAAYELAADRAPKDLNGKSVQEAKVVIVGAGKMTRLLLTHMGSHGLERCVVVNRSRPRAEELKAEYLESHGIDIEVALSEDLEMHLRDADLVFTASSAEGYVVTADHCTDRTAESPVMLVDIAVPRNVDPATVGLPHVGSYDVDSLKAVVAKNTAKRRKEILEAEKLLDDDSKTFRSWLSSLGAVPEIMRLQHKAEELRQVEMRRANAKLASLSQKELEAVERLSRGIVSKLLHGPMSSVRATDQSPSEKQGALKLLKSMFNLS